MILLLTVLLTNSFLYLCDIASYFYTWTFTCIENTKRISSLHWLSPTLTCSTTTVMISHLYPHAKQITSLFDVFYELCFLHYQRLTPSRCLSSPPSLFYTNQLTHVQIQVSSVSVTMDTVPLCCWAHMIIKAHLFLTLFASCVLAISSNYLLTLHPIKWNTVRLWGIVCLCL